MTKNISTIRERIQAQGFCGFDDASYTQFNYPLRLSPSICMVWATLGTALASPTILWALVPFAALGGILRSHPFDVIYNHGLRHIFKTLPLPPYTNRRRFACVMATAMLIISAWGFQAGLLMLCYIMGGSLVAAAFVNVSTGFCIPSFIARIFFGKVVCD